MLRKTISFTLLAFLAVASGCTSFRTTALRRFENDSVAKEPTNQKLKGLPVKLKIPSHVHVAIYEQQVILANTDDDIKALKDKAVADAGKVKELQNQIEGLGETRDAALAKRDGLRIEIDRAKAAIQAASGPNKDELVKSAEKRRDTATVGLSTADSELSTAEDALADLPNLQQKLQQAIAKAQVSATDAAIKYTLVSFTPSQYLVETHLEYTDKIFLVDLNDLLGES